MRQYLLFMACLLLITAILGGVFLAFGYMDWRWLGLSVLAFVILMGAIRE